MKVKLFFTVFIFIIFSLFICGCKKDDNTVSAVPVTIPKVRTALVDFITQNSAYCVGSIEDYKNQKISSMGVYWNTTGNPTSKDSISPARITGLKPNTTYYVRAYATNSAGTGVGEVINFTTPSAMTDEEGNTYNTVIISGKTWMAENLKTTKFQNGDPIPNVMTDTAWSKCKSPAFCNFNNDQSTAKTYGKLYNWYAVNDNRKIAPKGWHIPEESEWNNLLKYFSGKDVAYNFMEEGTAHWGSSNTQSSNFTRFAALPGAFRYQNGEFKSSDIGNSCGWWSTTEQSGGNVSCRLITPNDYSFKSIVKEKEWGLSVRCVKD